MLFAQLAVENTTYRFDKPFTYTVPEALAGAVRPGVRVTVPFGAGNRTRVGMVLSVSEAPAADGRPPMAWRPRPGRCGDLLLCRRVLPSGRSDVCTKRDENL